MAWRHRACAGGGLHITHFVFAFSRYCSCPSVVITLIIELGPCCLHIWYTWYLKMSRPVRVTIAREARWLAIGWNRTFWYFWRHGTWDIQACIKNCFYWKHRKTSQSVTQLQAVGCLSLLLANTTSGAFSLAFFLKDPWAPELYSS